ncbi:23S rRNA pseudouridine1911/1915/1917 synthase [Mariprofundus micogutta]|uniref:23S rRNA pseudouridine1911/1915/1917 synthase n=1 Tax=Mariprofundus micogutta TaxID=1921010 RepID=A0A1L8CLL6_9PROT|nr:RluA family pseudouridine synthase [Mariprofundus micogutta]GAV19817.1 23S rRNA pseudouridine1911/1915/1917 synthase [Mariprofundus micogutta]
MSSTAGYQDLRGTADQKQHGQRLDQGLALLFDLSRRRIRRAIDEGGVYLNQKRCRTAGRKLSSGDKLRIVLLEKEKLIPFDSSQLLWQKPPLYLINKRAGQYSQEALHRSRGTLPDELGRHLGLPAALASTLRPVHRLDRGTSGLMLFSSDPALLQQLQANWKSCTFKTYLAVVEPAPEWQSREINLPIGPLRDKLGRYHVNEHGRPCRTSAEVIERKGNRALLRLQLHTGRTHQLRVHLSTLACPILGDIRYGGKGHPRLMLHAENLRIIQPALPDNTEWNAPPEENWQW